MAYVLIDETLTGTTASASATIKGNFDFSLAGTFTGSVTIERSYDDGATWRAVESYTAPTETYGVAAATDVRYRAKPDLSAGSAEVVIAQ